MVQFPVDADSRTTGNGRFDSTVTHPAIIDPPPHNVAYFSSKMKFVENYFRRASDGALIVKGDVLPSVLTVDRPMSEYARATTPAFSGLTQLALDGWRKADSASPGTDFASYDAFVLFHAGAGKDLDLVAILGYDPAPYDLPSVYLGLESLRTGLDSAAFSGIAVSGGAFRITNTMILPETETRVFSSSVGNDTLELSLNGLFAASVGSHLGLPDLFDTKTGRPGIGQHGLMDGASIFAYLGICPPEPSAWEKIHLGWVTPIDVDGPVDTLNLPAVGLTTSTDTVYRVRINSSEYYLIENRIRDPLGNGQRLTVFRDRLTSILAFPSDSTGFYTFDNISGIDGSVIDVEDLDWSLVGRFGTGGRFDGGGILIWHVDEDRISAGLLENSVNADPDLRGVDLEEADGSQDIGESYAFLTGGSGSESGSPLDAWFFENEARPYANRFDDTSFPNSRTSTGASSLVTIRDFSARSARMSAVVEHGTSRVVGLSGFPKQLTGELGPALTFDLDGNGTAEFITSRVMTTGVSGRGGTPTGKGALLAWFGSGASVASSSDSVGLAAETDGSVVGMPAVSAHPSGGAPIVAATTPGMLYLWRAQDGNADQRWDEVARAALPADTVAWNVMIRDTLVVAYGPAGVAVNSISGLPVTSFVPGAHSMAWTGTGAQFVAGVGSDIYRLMISPSGRPSDVFAPIRSAGGAVTAVVAGQVDGTTTAVAVQSEGIAGASRVTILNAGDLSLIGTFDLALGLRSGETILGTLVLMDADRDGRKDILAPTSAGRVVMSTIQGVILDGAPRTVSQRGGWRNVDLLGGDIAGDGTPEVLSLDEAGVMSISPSSRSVGVQVGNPARTSAALGAIAVPQGTSTAIFVTDARGGVSAYDLRVSWSGPGAVWPMRRGNAAGTSFTSLPTVTPVPVATGLLPADRVYNWPNPVYGSETRMRFFTDRDGTVSIMIFDVAGDRVTELRGAAVGGRDNEIVWNVSGIQSGVYLARVEVTGGGQTASVVVKVAVVK